MKESVSGCPAQINGTGFEPFEHTDMYKYLADVRQNCPIFYASEIGYWVVTRHENAQSILRDKENYSAEIATQPICPWPEKMVNYLKDNGFTNEAVQVACDPPRHTRIRVVASRFLNIRQFSFYEDELRNLVRSYLDKLAGLKEVDLVDAIFYEFPAQVVFLLLGERNFDPRQIKKWGDLRLHMIWGKLSDEELETAVHDLMEFWQYADNLVEARKKKPGDDYPSFLLKKRDGNDDVLTENEIKSLVFGLLLAGHETTTNAAGNLFHSLLTRPEQWKKLVQNPDLIPNAVEEGLRYSSSVVAWRRIAKVPVTVAGKAFPAGTKFLISLGSANHDEAKFDNSEKFDIERKNSRDHLAFGNGIHACLGAPLARMELKILLEEFTAYFPEMALVPNQKIGWTKTISFRGPDTLKVLLNR